MFTLADLVASDVLGAIAGGTQGHLGPLSPHPRRQDDDIRSHEEPI
jgi:hypothetical protein